MPTYNSLIDRTDAGALIPEEVTREIAEGLPQQSTVLQMARRLPNMATNQYRMPVLSVLPTAYFVAGDTGLKQTTEQVWANKYLNAEEIACIIPIPQTVVDDVDYDIWGQIRPRIVEAFGKVIDLAVFHGTNKPSSWPTDIVAAATAAGNYVTLGAGDLYDAMLGVGGVIGSVEADGYMPTGHVAAMTMRAQLRGLRTSEGMPIFLRNIDTGTARWELDGEPIYFPRNAGIDPTAALLITGDWTQLVYSIRQDMTFSIHTEGVVTDANGAVQYNLWQQDMAAMRCVMRLAIQVPNPINTLQPTETSRFPFGVLKP